MKYVWILLFLCIYPLRSQEVPLDSLYQLPFEELDLQFRNLSKTEQQLLSTTYIEQARNQKDSLKIVYGYFLMGVVKYYTPEGLFYGDSIIKRTVNWKHKLFPGIGYLEKGIQLYYLGRYEKALDFYLRALDFFEKYKDKYNTLRVRHYIAILKNITNQHDEAITIFEKNILFFNDQNKEKYQDQYFKSLFALADCYNRNQKYDLAEEINKVGIRESSIKNSDLYPHFLLSFGTSKILNNQPRIGIDSIKKGGNSSKIRKVFMCLVYKIERRVFKTKSAGICRNLSIKG